MSRRLRSRSGRLHEFADNAEVVDTLGRLLVIDDSGSALADLKFGEGAQVDQGDLLVVME